MTPKDKPSNHREHPAAYLGWFNWVFSWCPQDPLAEDTANVAKPAEQTIEAGKQLTRDPHQKSFCPSEDKTTGLRFVSAPGSYRPVPDVEITGRAAS